MAKIPSHPFKNPQQLRVFAIALVIGAGFIMVAVRFLDTDSGVLLGQLIGVVIFLIVLIGLAAFIAWLVRKILNRIQQNKL